MRWDEGIRQREAVLHHLKHFGPASGPDLMRATGALRSVISRLSREKIITHKDGRYHDLLSR